jgi:predicted  nucleic acid-binding Zn-ribbon protein
MSNNTEAQNKGAVACQRCKVISSESDVAAQNGYCPECGEFLLYDEEYSDEQ